ncbi:hypothetical protein Trydic_g8804 [Trypoxylus dichotomus]
MKDEGAGKLLLAFVGLRAKMYACKYKDSNIKGAKVNSKAEDNGRRLCQVFNGRDRDARYPVVKAHIIYDRSEENLYSRVRMITSVFEYQD